jgi:hypothetical protein
LKVTGKFCGIVNKDDKKWKVSFVVGGKTWNFAVFKSYVKSDGTPKKGIEPTKLIMDKVYTIFYKEFKTPEMEFAAKTATNFFESKEKAAEAVKQESQSLQDLSVAKEQTKLDTGKVTTLAEDIILVINRLDNFDDFIRVYFTKMEKEKQSVNHMAGTYLLSKFHKHFEKLEKACEIAIKA